MILYHGSTMIVDSPKIIKTEFGRDFGFGFYTTDIKSQAERWALRKNTILGRKNIISSAILNVYDFKEEALTKLIIKNFSGPDLEWLDMVCLCRSNIKYTHGFDIVIGKIANDDVGETVSYVVRGIMRKEDALNRLMFEQINNQICFSTSKALQNLTYIGHEVLS